MKWEGKQEMQGNDDESMPERTQGRHQRADGHAAQPSPGGHGGMQVPVAQPGSNEL